MQPILGKRKSNSFSDFRNPLKNSVKNKLKIRVMVIITFLTRDGAYNGINMYRVEYSPQAN